MRVNKDEREELRTEKIIETIKTKPLNKTKLDISVSFVSFALPFCEFCCQ